jgi:hypothetical protein
VFRFLREFGAESHADERLAARWHGLHVVAYGLLIFFYCGSIAWHLAAAARHRRAATLLDSARRANSGVADDDQGC